MSHHRDFEELLSALSRERAEFLIVGAYAVMTYTEPRYTKDLDVWVRPTRTNAQRVHRALARFGAPLTNLRVSDLSKEGIIFQIGVEPVRIDILTQLDGVTFERAWAKRVEGSYGKAAISILSVDDLIANKTAVGRPQDLLDVQKLSAASAPPPILTTRRSAAKRRRRRGRTRRSR